MNKNKINRLRASGMVFAADAGGDGGASQDGAQATQSTQGASQTGASAQPAAGQSATGQGATGSQAREWTPPWNDANPLDPERATKLFQNLHAEREDFKTKLAEAQSKLDEAEKAKMSDLDRVTRERDDALKSNTTLELENARLKAAITHNLSEDDLEWISGSTPEEIATKAAKYAERHASSGASATNSPTSRPREALRGGLTPTEAPTETDPLKLADSIPQ